MAISVNDLPQKYQKQALQKILEAGKRPAKESKYHNRRAERISETGTIIRFASEKEADRYDVLMARLRRGEIQNLRLQQEFTLVEAFTDTNGKRTRAMRYRADFVYKEPTDNDGPAYKTAYNQTSTAWREVVEDVKGERTDVYKLKKKLMKERFNIDIKEV